MKYSKEEREKLAKELDVDLMMWENHRIFCYMPCHEDYEEEDEAKSFSAKELIREVNKYLGKHELEDAEISVHFDMSGVELYVGHEKPRDPKDVEYWIERGIESRDFENNREKDERKKEFEKLKKEFG